MRPKLPPEKKRKMVSFMISPESQQLLELLFTNYKAKFFYRFTKTDIFEMAIKHFAQYSEKDDMQIMYEKFIHKK